MEQALLFAYQHTPLGWLKIIGSENCISEVAFLNETPTDAEIEAPVPAQLANCVEQIAEYFKGTRKNFDLPLNPNGTEFQHKVWEQLKQIPFGKTHSYLDVALNL